MWTVFLVEDEPYVREAVRELVDWNRHGFRVIGEAGDGEGALEAILELKPDVVIADIVMPGLDGIELLRETRRAGIPSRFVMLTAMNDFDYAREALQYGAFNYLLKLSLTDDLLLETLGRIKTELREELKERTAAQLPRLRRMWAEIWGMEASAGDTAGEEEGDWGSLARFHLTIVTVLSGGQPAVLEQMLGNSGAFEAVYRFFEWGTTTYFCWGQQLPETGAHNGLTGLGFAYAADAAEVHSHTIRETWKKALYALSESWYGGSAASLEDRESAIHAARALEAEVVRAFEEKQDNRCRQALESLWKMNQSLASPHMEVKQMALRLAQTFAMLAGQRPDHAFVFEAISHESLLRQLLQYAGCLISRPLGLDSQETDHPVVNRLILHMQKHYRENLKISDLAGLVSMNVDYISTVFGKKTGMTPVLYLQNIRVEQAKRMLLSSKLSVSEIALQSGFADDAYFIRVFKRLTGHTPSAYRKMNGF